MGGWGPLAGGNLGVTQKYHVLNAHRDTESEGQNRTSGLLLYSLTILGYWRGLNVVSAGSCLPWMDSI